MVDWALLSSKTSWQGAFIADIQPIVKSCHFLQGSKMLFKTRNYRRSTYHIWHWPFTQSFWSQMKPIPKPILKGVPCTIFLAYVNNVSSFSKASPASPPWVKTRLNLVLGQLWVKHWPPTTPGGPGQPWYFGWSPWWHWWPYLLHAPDKLYDLEDFNL